MGLTHQVRSRQLAKSLRTVIVPMNFSLSKQLLDYIAYDEVSASAKAATNSPMNFLPSSRHNIITKRHDQHTED